MRTQQNWALQICNQRQGQKSSLELWGGCGSTQALGALMQKEPVLDKALGCLHSQLEEQNVNSCSVLRIFGALLSSILEQQGSWFHISLLSHTLFQSLILTLLTERAISISSCSHSSQNLSSWGILLFPPATSPTHHFKLFLAFKAKCSCFFLLNFSDIPSSSTLLLFSYNKEKKWLKSSFSRWIKNCTNLDSAAHLWEEFFFSHHMLYRENKLKIPWQRNSLESIFPGKPKTPWHRTRSGEGWDRFGSETLPTPSSSSQLSPLHHFSRICRQWRAQPGPQLCSTQPKAPLAELPLQSKGTLFMWHCSDTAPHLEVNDFPEDDRKQKK